MASAKTEDKLLAKAKEFVEYYKLEGKEEPVNICLHDAPDPDCVGSGLGISLFLKSNGIESKIFYGGEISHPQNKTIVNVLNISMSKTTKPIQGVNVCVDCTEHNSVAENPTLVIDHHKSQTKAKFQIIEPSYGACSTLIWKLIKQIEFDASEVNIYTALLLGIRTDTNDLVSETMTRDDFVAYQELLDLADKEALQKVMNYPFPRYLYDKRVVLHKDENSYEANGMFVGGIGFIPSDQRDVISILAEEYARMESVQTAVVFAITDKKNLEVSIRSTNVSLDVNQMCKDLFGDYGGGKTNAGGAKIPLTFYNDIDGSLGSEFWKITRSHMFKKILREGWSSEEEPKGK